MVRPPTYSQLAKNSTFPDSSIRSASSGVVGADLRLAGPLVQGPPRARALNAAAAEQRRRDPVERGGLVQADEGIGVEPVSADTVAPVDEGYPHIGVVDSASANARPWRRRPPRGSRHLQCPSRVNPSTAAALRPRSRGNRETAQAGRRDIDAMSTSGLKQVASYRRDPRADRGASAMRAQPDSRRRRRGGFATRGARKCRCQALKAPGWIWRDTTQEQRDVALLEQTACGTRRPDVRADRIRRRRAGRAGWRSNSV